MANEPVAALDEDIAPDVAAPFWAQERNMWCTGALLHAAGRSHPSFVFEDARVLVHRDGKTQRVPADAVAKKSAVAIDLHVFRVVSPDAYGPAMTQALKGLLAGYSEGKRTP